MRPIALLTRHRENINVAIIALSGFLFATALGRYYFFGSSFQCFRLTIDGGDQYKCHALLDSGRWLDPGNLQNWQPSSCMMHAYKPKQVQNCFSGRRIVLAGDSMVRETFWAIARQFDANGQLASPKESEKHSNVHITVDNTKLDFFWDPYLNATGVDAAFNYPDDVAKPAMTIVGTGLWYAKNSGHDAFKLWKSAVDTIALMTQGQTGKESPSDLIVVLPVLEPDYSRLSEARKSITPDTVFQMNSYLEQLSAAKYANIALSFNKMLASSTPETTHDGDGLHLVNKVTAAQAQVLINLRCNDHLDKKFPFDTTCCMKYPVPNFIQLCFFAVVLLVLPVIFHLQSQDRLKKPYIPSDGILTALLTFGWILIYAYYTDRTHLFGKEQKQFSLEQFWFLIFLTGVIGYLTSETAEKDQLFLSRDQTDEWKGWMQILILIYHYLGASKVAWIYNIIRVLVAMYLFMTGFGHTVFFYKKADFGFKRVVAVLVRLNMLNVVLAYTMDTDYLFYYFSPLVSFWFGVVWVTMWVKHDRNKDMRFLGAKIAISAILVTTFTKTPGVLEAVFSVLSTVARIHWDAVEWRFRVSLDMWIVYFGMIVAILFVKSSEITSSQHWQRIRAITLGTSLVMIPAYIIFEASLPSKFVYNKWHPYISFLPIVAFIVLRNASPHFRNTHSAAFAFIGRCSLETFILQFHIWLAGDTKGLLVVIGPSRWRWVSFILGTIVFVFISWKMGKVTGSITEWIMGSQKKAAPATTPAPVATPLEVVSVADGEKKEETDVKADEEPAPNGHTHEEMELLPPPVTSVRTLSFNEKLIRVLGIYWQDLRIRTVTIVIFLWFLNLVSHL
jgi:N-acetylneuraminate 9-O-acetyltransferase